MGPGAATRVCKIAHITYTYCCCYIDNRLCYIDRSMGIIVLLYGTNVALDSIRNDVSI